MDVIVVGGGPGGASAAFFHAKRGKSVMLIEKESFPRDKVCGDGVTGKSLGVLRDMGLIELMSEMKEIPCTDVLLSSPNRREITIPMHNPSAPSSAFCIERERFDAAVYRAAVKEVLDNGGVVVQERVKEVLTDDGCVVGVRTESGEYRAPLTIGAAGYNCPISRHLLATTGLPQQDKEKYAAATREYWTGLNCDPGVFEIHFIDEIRPGYFWIFPISETKFNVGIGMLLKDMDKQKVKLRGMLDWVINESHLAPKFAGAQVVEGTRKGWMLPFGTGELRKAHMPGARLVGDAASLVDPFTGEGIGNALVSGKLSAMYESGEGYQLALEEAVASELGNSHRLQKLLRYPKLVNWLFRKAVKSEDLQSVLTEMLTYKDEQEKFRSKLFWAKTLLF